MFSPAACENHVTYFENIVMFRIINKDTSALQIDIVMKKIITTSLIPILFMLILISGCDVIKKLPTNTTGGVFSLNGNWRMESSTDNNALTGTTVGVYPISGEGIITVIQNNTYCIRTNDVMWKSIVSANNGGFTVSNLSNSCTGSLVYKPATLSVINNEEVRLNGTTTSGNTLVQTWRRVVK